MEKPYQHFSLESRSIRIIVLEPASDPDSKIQCGLYKTSLDYAVNFEALSYSWDGQSPDQPIECRTVHSLDDDSDTPYGSLAVTMNCVHALRALRRESERRLLWIDGICINQADIDEKSVQVALMGELYAASYGVIVWLGNKDEAAERAFRFVLDVGASMEDIGTRHRGGEPMRSKTSIAEDETLRDSLKQMLLTLRDMSKDEFKSDSDDPLRPLLNRSWFHRMWTVQEVVLPVRSTITIQCGDLQAWLPTLLFVVNRIQVAGLTKSGVQASMKLQLTLIDELSRRRMASMEKHNDMEELEQGFMRDFTMTNFSHALNIYNQGVGDDTSTIKLSAILDGARKKQATEAVDKVFALYGVLQELGIPMPAPNYRTPADEVFFDAAVASISADKSLEVLYLAVTETRRDNLPSWVPDLMDHGFGNMDPRNCAGDADRFTAGSALSPAWEFLPSRRLRVRAKLVDTVTKSLPSFDVYVESLKGHDDNLTRSQTSQGRLLDSHKAFLVLRQWAEAVRSLAANYPSRKEMMMSFLKVLLHDEESCIKHAEEEDRFERWFSTLEKDDMELLRSLLIEKEKKKSEAKVAKAAEYKGPSVFKQLKTWRTQMSAALDERTVSSKSFAVDVLARTEMHNVTLPSMEPVLNLHLAVLRYARRQAFFTTEMGRFGCAPNRIAAGAVREGDRIAVVAGLNLPFLLRPLKRGVSVGERDEYELISYCYQDGIMYGEVVHGDGTELQDVVLV